ncbi:vesicular glutamate transporter 1 [Agrilus planipennis]|uniref:Vesicular glutamate transporter 1 n=1 Tax=Agrilus planipennis TaxID=224129 RepID=A0A1W4WLD3_AGRPL|nr:vesicular glutamate transporter 1 [Agrilus planipennis]
MRGVSAIGGAIKSLRSGDIGARWDTKYEEFGLQKQSDSVDKPADDLSSPESIPEPERPPLRHIDKYIRPECPCLTKRVTVALLACLGFMIMFGMRTNMGLVKAGEKNITSKWSPAETSALDSSIFWGYFITQIPGGFLATKYPANKLFGMAIVSSSIIHLFLPGAMSFSTTHVALMLRVMQGLVEGVTYPACHGIWRYWAPPLERSRLATLAFCGTYAGVMFAMPLSGELIKRLGWQSPFYFYGCLGMIWYLNWLWLVFERPCKHPTIEARELLYIENSLGNAADSHTIPSIYNTPWKAFFTSLPVYAIFVANFCRSYNFYLLVLFQPKYMKEVFDMDLEENAFLGALPHLLMTIIVPTGGILADHLRKKEILTTTQVRKLFNCGGFFMEATFFLVVAYAKTASAAVIALSMGVAFSGFAISGFNVNHLDIAPKYASILMGLSNGIGTLAGSVCPYIVTTIKENTGPGASKQWKIVFIVAAIVHYIGITFYGFFASGELQPWADLDKDKNWNPYDAAFKGEIKTSSSMQSNGLLQRQLSGKNINYGSVDPMSPPPPPYSPPIVQSGNPFTGNVPNTNPFRQEAVQPEPSDTYMHGGVDDRTY